MTSKTDTLPPRPAAPKACKCCKPLLSVAHDCLNKLWPPSATPRERILAAASDLFYREGLHAISVDTIAAAANTNKMTLYRHFRSKDDLIAAYLRKLAEEGLLIWKDIEARHPNDPKGHLLEWIECTGPATVLPFNRGCAFINALAELPDSTHPGRHVIDEYKAQYRVLILDTCRAAKLTEPELLADELHLLFEGAVVSAQNIPPEAATALFVKLGRMVVDAHDPAKQKDKTSG